MTKFVRDVLYTLGHAGSQPGIRACARFLVLTRIISKVPWLDRHRRDVIHRSGPRKMDAFFRHLVQGKRVPWGRWRKLEECTIASLGENR